MNPGCSLVDLLLLPIYFQFRKNKGNKTVWPPPFDCTLGWARKRRLAASFEKTAQSDCHWCLNEMKVGAKRKKQQSYISLLIIPCMIVYVTNNKEPWKNITFKWLSIIAR